jgi:hypothetical protein
MKSILVFLSLLSVAFLMGCGSEYPLTTNSPSRDTTNGTASNSADTFKWSGEKKLSATQTIPVGATYWCAPGTQVLLPDNANVLVKGSLVLSGTADSPVRIICPSNATISIVGTAGKVNAAHLFSNGNGGTLFTGAGGSCILDNIEINGYSIAIAGYFTSLSILDAAFQDNGAAVSLASTYDYASHSSLNDLKISGARITGSGRQTGIGLILNDVIGENANVLVQQTLFSNLKSAVSYAVPMPKAHFTAVNVTMKNCIDGFAPLAGNSSAFDTMIVSNSDISTQNTAISLDSIQGVNLLLVENSNVRSQSGLPLKIGLNAATKVDINQVALIDRSGEAFSPLQVNDIVASSGNIKRLVLDPGAVSGRGMGYDFTAAKPESSTTTTPAIPGVPAITGVIVGDKSVTLTWGPIDSSAKYNVYFDTGTTVDTSDAAFSDVTSPKAITVLSNGLNYTFAVIAYNNLGKSHLSSPVTAKPLKKPAAPMIVSAIAADGAVTLHWDSVAYADSYNLYYRMGSTVDVLSAKFTNVTSPKTVTGLTNGVQYAFAVSAINSMGESDLSSLDTLIPHAALIAPVISATTAADGSVTLAWAPVNGATSYNVYYAAGTAATASDAKIVATTSPKTITGLSNGTQYAFAVSATGASTESSLSAISTATPQASLVTPASPLNVTALAGNGIVTVSWNPVAGATTYNVYYAADSVATKNDARIAGAASPKIITGLSNGTTYAFAVSAASGASNESELSAVKTAVPQAPLVAPASPLNVTATAGAGAVTVSWNPVSGASSYTVYYTAGITVNKTGATFTGATSPKSIQGLSNGTVYAFAVAAVNAAGESDLSVVKTAMPVVAPGAPVITTLTPGDSTVTVSWGAVALATSYNLYYAAGTAVNKSGFKLASVTSPFTVRALTNGIPYAFAVAAANTDGESGLSAVQTASPGLPPPSAPVGVNAVAAQEQVTVTWSPVGGAVSYNIYYTQGATVDKTGTKLSNVTSPKIVTQLTAGAPWAFCVTAVNAGGESVISDVATAIPTSKN